MKPLVGILMGSDSDLEVMGEAAAILEKLGIPHEIQTLSTHRAPQETAIWAKSAKTRGFKVIIAGAGGAAALAGAIAAQTALPVIGVPIKSKSLEGLDALLSIAQMPPGVPVATVGINCAKNAGLLSAQILALSDADLARRFEEYKNSLKKEVLQKNSKLQKLGWRKYLAEKQK